MAIKATHIRMKRESASSVEEIDLIRLTGDKVGDYKKADVYDFVEKDRLVIQVDIGPKYPKLFGAISKNNEKYVKSTSNDDEHDNLLDLPKF